MKRTHLSAALAIAIAASSAAGPVATIPGRLEILAKGEDTAELLIYGDIGDSWWGESVAAADVVKQLNGITASTIEVRINSYGGSVTDGLAIYNALKRHKATINVTIDGIAASIASVIACAGDTVQMAANTILMVHAPWGGAWGNVRDLEAYIDVLKVMEGSIATSYAAKTGKTVDAMLLLLRDYQDHYYTAAEAKELGFCDVITEDAATEEAAESAKAQVAAQAAFAPYLERMPERIAAAFRTPNTRSGPAAAAPKSSASADAPPPAVAGNTTGDVAMTEEEKKAAAKARDEALAALRTRNTEILDMAKPHMGNADVKAYVEKVIADADPAVTAANVGKHILALMANGAGPLNGNAGVVAGKDQRDLTRKAMANAIEARVGFAKAEGDNPYRGFTMVDLARESLAQAGVSTRGLDRKEIVGLAFTHSTSDFPGLLGDTARKAVLQGYEEAEETFDQFTRPVSVPDFKPTNLAGLGAFSDLLVVPEGGEYKYGTFSEQSQAMQIVTYGRLFSITRQAIINDDLGVFNDVPRKLGQAAKRTIAKAIFNLINSNPILADGFALFSAEHGNLLTGAAISTTSVDAMRQAMALQKDKDGNIIRVPLKTLLTPIALGGLARTVRESQYEVSGNKNLTTPNIVRNTFEVVDDGRLDAASATAWYGVASNSVVDSIVVGYLDGNQTPYLEQHEGFTVDGVAWKVRLDAAPAIADYRGIYKNPGA
ncbi:TPA: Clp protease ClpP [Stenotrophomonas maltophilia]|nr:Clp protease ClpP [Stenotrophomonas maltophilia]